MIIEKQQHDPEQYRLHWSFYPSARQGFRQVLKASGCRKILLPAYIGAGAITGAGMFEPVRDAGVPFEFYRFDRHLSIDVDDICIRMERNAGYAVLLAHFCGFKDRNLDRIKAKARECRMTVIEDLSHALFTFWKNPVPDFDYGIFSLHKMLPRENGGAVLSRIPLSGESPAENLFAYNMGAIAEKRTANYRFLLERLRPHTMLNRITILRRSPGSNVPQSFPILVDNRELRDHLYFTLTDAGFGVSSIYHSLIKELNSRVYRTEHALSGRMLNLPVHQDVDTRDLETLLDRLFAVIREYGVSRILWRARQKAGAQNKDRAA